MKEEGTQPEIKSDDDVIVINYGKYIAKALSTCSTLMFGGYLLLDAAREKFIAVKNRIFTNKNEIRTTLDVNQTIQQTTILDKKKEYVYQKPFRRDL